MGPRHWLALVMFVVLQLGVLASPHTHKHKHHHHNHHIKIVLKDAEVLPPSPGEDLPPTDTNDKTANLYINVHYANGPSTPGEEDLPPSPVDDTAAAVLYAEEPTSINSTPVDSAAPSPAYGGSAVYGQPIAAPAPAPAPIAITPKPLPVFFFHGIASNNKSSYNFYANLTAEGRVVIALTFCQDLCSVASLNAQVPLAIQQIRATVANDTRFQNGYIFIGHSQGASIARAVVEEMDDHNVRTLISLAGPQNGIFYGPQQSDSIPTQAFINRLGPKTIPTSVFNFSDYGASDLFSGKFQSDFNALVFQYPVLQNKLSVMNLGRSPVKREWRSVNTFLPVLNNLNPCDGATSDACEAAKQQRRTNFLKLKSAHFFGSPADDVIAPWQTSLLGQYTDLATTTDLLTNFLLLEPMDMKLTEEYQHDTYGLKTLEAKGGLFLYDVPNVSHSCWVADAIPLGKTEYCRWRPVYENYVYPLLQKHGWGVV